MKIVHIEYEYEPEVLNENFNIATFRKSEYTVFRIFYLTFKKIKIRNTGKTIYLQIEIFVSRHRYLDDDPP